MRALVGLLFLFLLMQLLLLFSVERDSDDVALLRVHKAFYDNMHVNAMIRERATIGLFLGLKFLFERPDLISEEVVDYIMRGGDISSFLKNPSVVSLFERAMEIGSEMSVRSLTDRGGLKDSNVSEGEELVFIAECYSPTPQDLYESSYLSVVDGPTLVYDKDCVDLVKVSLLLDDEAVSSVDLSQLSIYELLHNAIVDVEVGKGSTVGYVLAYNGMASSVSFPYFRERVNATHLLNVLSAVVDSVDGRFVDNIKDKVDDLETLDEIYAVISEE